MFVCRPAVLANHFDGLDVLIGLSCRIGAIENMSMELFTLALELIGVSGRMLAESFPASCSTTLVGLMTASTR